MTIERIAHSGAWLCTAMKGNRLVRMTYYLITKRAALADFKAYLKGIES